MDEDDQIKGDSTDAPRAESASSDASDAASPQQPPRTEKQKDSTFCNDVAHLLRDKTVQRTLRALSPHGWLQVVKEIGAVMAVIAALIGYFLTWDAERSDRRADQIRDVIKEKIVWMRQADSGIMEVRKVRYLIRLKCEYHKPITPYEQAWQRFIARYQSVKAFTGIEQVYDYTIYNAFREFTHFDESVKDVCAKDAPRDTAWWQYLHDVNHLMRQSIQKDRNQLIKINQGLFFILMSGL